MKKAFITGINGQDGSYLSEYLLSLGYEVHGIVRRNSVPEHQQSRIEDIKDRMHVYYGDVLDQTSLQKLLDKILKLKLIPIKGVHTHIYIYDE